MKIESFKLQLWNLHKTKERELQGACENLVKISQSVFAFLTFDQSSLNFTDPLVNYLGSQVPKSIVRISKMCAPCTVSLLHFISWHKNFLFHYRYSTEASTEEETSGTPVPGSNHDRLSDLKIIDQMLKTYDRRATPTNKVGGPTKVDCELFIRSFGSISEKTMVGLFLQNYYYHLAMASWLCRF